MTIHRTMSQTLQESWSQFPIVTVTGPRQAGKTTLIKDHFSNLAYVNLEDPKTREFAQTDPQGFLKKLSQGGIIDEVQRVPELMSYLQIIVDEKNTPGQFVLTGSHQFLLMKSVNQSLAGRSAILNLLPFSITELFQAKILKQEQLDADLVMTKGFYPRLYSNRVMTNRFYSAYVQTYVERDVRELLTIKDLSLFKKFISLCAGRIGQILNRESLSRDIGVSAKTVEEWLSVLEASFVILRLQPYFENFSKRVVKSPKIYFYDVGLACFFLGIENKNHLENHPLRGNLFENMQIIEAIKWRLNTGRPHQMYFYRDTNGNEIDLLFTQAGKLYPIEIRSSQTFHMDFLKSIKHLSKDIKLEHPVVVYGGTEAQERTDFTLTPWHELAVQMEKMCPTRTESSAPAITACEA